MEIITAEDMSGGVVGPASPFVFWKEVQVELWLWLCVWKWVELLRGPWLMDGMIKGCWAVIIVVTAGREGKINVVWISPTCYLYVTTTLLVVMVIVVKVAI